VIRTGHTFVDNLHHGHDEVGLDVNPRHRFPAAVSELVRAV
jgi:hypothetical protein